MSKFERFYNSLFRLRAVDTGHTNDCEVIWDESRRQAMLEALVTRNPWRVAVEEARVAVGLDLLAPDASAVDSVQALLKEHAAQLPQALAAIEQLEKALRDLTEKVLPNVRETGEAYRRDAERYRVLRCYRLGGSWPRDREAPGGLLAWTPGTPGDHYEMTQGELDKTLDNLLGYTPHSDPQTRKDYQAWIRARTIERVAAVGGRVE